MHAADAHVLCSRSEGPVAEAQLSALFKPRLAELFSAAFRTAARSQDAFAQLCSLLDLWSSRGVFNLATAATVRARMLDVVRGRHACVAATSLRSRAR
jgi:hypothetical protein